jgi:transcription elongation factor Elf1
MSRVLPCPRCGREVDYRYTDTDQRARRFFYKCKSDDCRNHFRAVEVPGLPMQVTSQSPPDRRTIPTVGHMGCPSCNVYGKVKTSFRREDGYWRRHQCLTCGPYFTCEPIANEMGISVHKKMKALHPIR